MIKLSPMSLLLTGALFASSGCDVAPGPSPALEPSVARTALTDECDPFEVSCEDDDVCLWSEERFMCLPGGLGSGPGEECGHEQPCAYGSVCLEPRFFYVCDPDLEGCCAPYCDNTHPCPTGWQCTPDFIRPGLGLCGDEPPDPDPGQT